MADRRGRDPALTIGFAHLLGQRLAVLIAAVVLTGGIAIVIRRRLGWMQPEGNLP